MRVLANLPRSGQRDYARPAKIRCSDISPQEVSRESGLGVASQTVAWYHIEQSRVANSVDAIVLARSP